MRARAMIGAVCVAAGCQSPMNEHRSAEVVAPAATVALPKPSEPAKEKPVAALPVSAKKSDAAAIDHLMAAAECMERHDSASAADHLRSHIEVHPQQLMIRAYLAESLFKQSAFEEAQWQFERFVADAQLVGGPPRQHLLHCHTRLMEIAEAKGDGAAEHLHRGIGLYLLAVESREREGAVEENMPERLFLKATEELKVARKLAPSDGRAGWYLSCVWRELGQGETARIALENTVAVLASSTLTAAERRELLMAGR